MAGDRTIRPDPDVVKLVDGMHQQRRKRTNRKPTSEERQAAEQRRQVMRSRVTYDLPADISQAVKDLALELDCPDSQVAALLLFYALQDAAEIDWDAHKVPSQSHKKKFNLEIPQKIRK